MNCKQFGWNDFFEAVWNSTEREGRKPARILSQNRGIWHIGGDFGEAKAGPAGKLRLAAEFGADWPAVGDWVGAEANETRGFRICEVLPRRTKITRKAAGKQIVEQVLAANVDTVFLVMALDGDFNARRMERYLAQVWESGARPAILLNKADLCTDTVSKVAEVERCSPGVAVLTISATQGQGIKDLVAYLPAGETAVLLGSSGVGKSSVVNCLLGQEEQKVGAVRPYDSRGRHTTTRRQLLFLKAGAMIIDTPGLRELQLWEAQEGVRHAFDELKELSAGCRFRDCSHQGEPGCAVTAALADGTLDIMRFESYQKLRREQEFMERKVDREARHKAKQQIKTVNRSIRQLYQQRDTKGKP